MICIISATHLDALRWAKAQELDQSEWFYASCEEDLLAKTNFHVVIGPTAHVLPASYFERLYRVAKARGKVGRR